MSDKIISIENARIRFLNFSGKAGRYNPEGRRNFCVLIDDDLADKLIEDNWNVKYLQPREEDEKPQAYLQVAVNFDNFPPKIVLITSGGKTRLDEDSVNILDWAEISNVDLIIRPYNWEVNGKRGRSAYLQALNVIQNIDRFAARYQKDELPF